MNGGQVHCKVTNKDPCSCLGLQEIWTEAHTELRDVVDKGSSISRGICRHDRRIGRLSQRVDMGSGCSG